MIDKHTEVALSEVIGFVLILALITTAASLYLVYGVPAQGRENEILHMGVVKDQFVEYKVGLDSLFTNNLVGTTTSNTFSLGTGGGYTQGANSIFPIMSPLSSGGIFLINRRTTLPETLSITSNSYIMGNGSFSVALPAPVNFTPNHVYVNISIPSSVPVNRTGNFGLTVNTSKWIATVNLTPQMTFYQYYNLSPAVNNPSPCTSEMTENGPGMIIPGDVNNYYSCLYPRNAFNYSGTDLTISITKGNIITMQNFPVYHNVVSGGQYTLDLMDTSYGINPVTLPGDTIGLVVDRPLDSVTGTGNITYDFAEQLSYTNPPITLGAIEYRSNNNYWIPQTYYYQMGGVFLVQSEGSTTYKLPPEISFTYDQESQISTVNINALAITSPSGGSVVGGSSPVQIKTTLLSNNALPYAVGTANTRSIRIGVYTEDDQARLMWKNYFNYTARAGNLPNTVTGNTTTESYIIINGTSLSETGETYDINVIAKNATYSAMVYGVG